MSARALRYSLLSLLFCTGCGGGAGGAGAVAGAPAALTAVKPTGDIVVQKVTVTGSIPDASGTTEVLVNGERAVITGNTWSIPMAYSQGKAVTITYRVDGVDVDSYQTVVTGSR